MTLSLLSGELPFFNDTQLPWFFTVLDELCPFAGTFKVVNTFLLQVKLFLKTWFYWLEAFPLSSGGDAVAHGFVLPQLSCRWLLSESLHFSTRLPSCQWCHWCLIVTACFTIITCSFSCAAVISLSTKQYALRWLYAQCYSFHWEDCLIPLLLNQGWY